MEEHADNSPIRRLEPEAQEEARLVARRVWAKTNELLGENDFAIRKDRVGGFNKLILQNRRSIDNNTRHPVPGQTMYLLIGRMKPDKKGRGTMLLQKEEYHFHSGGRVLKVKSSLLSRDLGKGGEVDVIKEEVETQEADRSDLEELLNALEKSKS